MSTNSPSIVIKTRFETGSGKQNHMKQLDKFIDYIARQEALSVKQNDFDLSKEDSEEMERIEKALSNLEMDNPIVEDLYAMDKYIDYMTRVKAIKVNEDRQLVNGAFSSKKKNVTKDDIKKIKEDVMEAKKNNAVMFQDVVSFDNQFLIDQGYYDPVTKKLDEDILYKAVSNMADTCIKKEDLKDAFWFSTIHRNTDNIHIHFTMMERKNTREMMEWNGELQARGKRKPKTLEDMKHSFGNTLLDLKNEYADISKIRTDFPKLYQKDLKDKLMDLYVEKQNNVKVKNNDQWLEKTLEELKSEIPTNTKGYNELSNATKKKIDTLTLHMTKNNNLREEYFKSVNYIDKTLNKTYGESHKSGSYYQAREKVLNERLGNACVREIKILKKSEEKGNVKEYIKSKNINLNPSINNGGFSFKTKNGIENNKNYLKDRRKREADRERRRKFFESQNNSFKNRKDLNKIRKVLNSDQDLYRAEQQYEEVQRKIMMEQQMREHGFDM